MGFELNDRVMALNVQLQSFMEKHIYPREHDWHEWCWTKISCGPRHLGTTSCARWQRRRVYGTCSFPMSISRGVPVSSMLKLRRCLKP